MAQPVDPPMTEPAHGVGIELIGLLLQLAPVLGVHEAVIPAVEAQRKLFQAARQPLVAVEANRNAEREMRLHFHPARACGRIGDRDV